MHPTAHAPIQQSLPQGYTFRAATRTDIPSIVLLFNLYCSLEAGTRPLTAEDVWSEWSTPNFQPATDIRMIFDNRGWPVAYVEVWTDSTSPDNPWLWGFVHPDYEGRNLGTCLVRWSEARLDMAQRYNRAHTPISPRTIAPNDLQRARPLFESFGWNNTPTRPGNFVGALQLYHHSGVLSCKGYSIFTKEFLPI